MAIGSKFPQSADSYTAGSSPYLASSVFAQLAMLVENTQRVVGQGCGSLSDLGNTTDDTFAKQFKKLLRVDFGRETYNSGSGTQIVSASTNQGTRELTVSFNTYGGSTVFSDASKIRVFVTEEGGCINSETVPAVNGSRKDSGNVVDGSITTAQFKWRHDETSAIGNIMWLAVQWEE